MRTWVDASVLIAFDRAGHLDRLRDCLGRIAITPEVEEEVFNGRESDRLKAARGDWIGVIPVEVDIERFRKLGLGRGEASLMAVPEGDRLVLDERPARVLAMSEGRLVKGSLGVLISGVRNRRISAEDAKQVVLDLLRTDFYLTGPLLLYILEEIEKA